jgi:prepilin-type N-terminal cleavage/methylation domain-containing protein
MSSRPRTHSSAGGFSLAEVLVALAVAAMMTAILTRFVAGTRAGAVNVAEATEMAVLGETLLARVASRDLQAGYSEEWHGGFAARIEITPILFEVRALRMNEKTGATPASRADRSDDPGNWRAYRIAVVIRAPSGRSYAVDTVKIGPGGTDAR